MYLRVFFFYCCCQYMDFFFIRLYNLCFLRNTLRKIPGVAIDKHVEKLCPKLSFLIFLNASKNWKCIKIIQISYYLLKKKKERKKAWAFVWFIKDKKQMDSSSLRRVGRDSESTKLMSLLTFFYP